MPDSLLRPDACVRTRAAEPPAPSHPRQRSVLEVLQARGPLPLVELARRVARLEREASEIELTPEAVTAVTIHLRHRHVPELVETGLIEHRTGRTVGRTADSSASSRSGRREQDDVVDSRPDSGESSQPDDQAVPGRLLAEVDEHRHDGDREREFDYDERPARPE